MTQSMSLRANRPLQLFAVLQIRCPVARQVTRTRTRPWRQHCRWQPWTRAGPRALAACLCTGSTAFPLPFLAVPHILWGATLCLAVLCRLHWFGCSMHLEISSASATLDSLDHEQTKPEIIKLMKPHIIKLMTPHIIKLMKPEIIKLMCCLS